MICLCTNPKCGHESQRVTNTKPCPWCGCSMRSIGSDYMSPADGSVSRPDGRRHLGPPVKLEDVLWVAFTLALTVVGVIIALAVIL